MPCSPCTFGRESLARLARAVALVVVLLASPACTVVDLAKDTLLAEQLALISGPVIHPGGDLDDVLVAIFRDQAGQLELTKIDQLSPAVRSYVFVVEASSPYLIVAFQDLDGDLAYDAEEPLGVLGEDTRIHLEPLALEEGRAIRLGRATPPRGANLVFDAEDLGALESVPIAAGDVVGLEDPRFDPERGVDGMWQPVASVQQRGLGIYFLEAFDPDRVPILFVHGIGGTPRDFRALIESLDHSRFQPWVFYYPSGIRVQQAANSLAGILHSLHEVHGFENLVWAAHSMGGLVSKAAILRLVEGGAPVDYVNLFVTFATPWGGHSAATHGVRFMPTVVPAWLDLQPGSDFLKHLEAPLPSTLPHHLFFGYDTGNSVIMLYSHDTVVSLESQLPLWAQEQASRQHGFNLDHMTILSEEASVERFRELLATWAPP